MCMTREGRLRNRLAAAVDAVDDAKEALEDSLSTLGDSVQAPEESACHCTRRALGGRRGVVAVPIVDGDSPDEWRAYAHSLAATAGAESAANLAFAYADALERI